MLVLHADDRFEAHATPEDHPECPGRARAVLLGLAGAPQVARRLSATPGDPADVLRVHDRGYVDALRGLAQGGGGSLDPDTWVCPVSYDVALSAAGTLCKATDDALAAAPDDPARTAFAVLRPPGHHARPASGMGFCLFNNVAVAAARARAVHGLSRVAIVDFDVHHGNGTQEMFWEDGSVFFASLHRDRFYPGTGKADETGAGAGRGTTLNLPLPASTSPARYQEAFLRAMDAVAAHRPELLIVSAGFDAYAGDPVGGLGLAPEHYAWIGARLRDVARAHADGRCVAALEGGYALEALPDLVAARMPQLFSDPRATFMDSRDLHRLARSSSTRAIFLDSRDLPRLARSSSAHAIFIGSRALRRVRSIVLDPFDVHRLGIFCDPECSSARRQGTEAASPEPAGLLGLTK
jgi:acetoin utilization deacetylase AcuC-like enzyme